MNKAAFFDIDGTLVKCLTQQVLAKVLAEKKIFSKTQYIKVLFWFILYKAGLINGSIKIRESIYLAFRNRPKKDFEAIFSETALKIIASQICLEMKNIIRSHKIHGDLVFAISGSILDLVKPICDEVDIQNIFATRLLFIDDYYTGAWDGDILEGTNKTKLIEFISQKYNISLCESFAYSDSISDLPMLKIVGHPVAVNPDIKLKKVAYRNRWPIIEC